jgi:hypothetical protein
MAKEKLVRSLADIGKVIETDKLEQPKKEEKTLRIGRTSEEEKPKKEKQLYEANNIRIKGTQLTTTDGNYETYSKGSYTSWKITMIGLKNGAVDINTNIDDGYHHGSFHDRNRAATILVEMINRYKK